MIIDRDKIDEWEKHRLRWDDQRKAAHHNLCSFVNIYFMISMKEKMILMISMKEKMISKIPMKEKK